MAHKKYGVQHKYDEEATYLTKPKDENIFPHGSFRERNPRKADPTHGPEDAMQDPRDREACMQGLALQEGKFWDRYKEVTQQLRYD